MTHRSVPWLQSVQTEREEVSSKAEADLHGHYGHPGDIWYVTLGCQFTICTKGSRLAVAKVERRARVRVMLDAVYCGGE